MKVIRFILTVFVFIGLKFWELFKFSGKLLVDIFNTVWKPILLIILFIGCFIGFMLGMTILIPWQYELLGGVVPNVVLIVADCVAIAFGVMFGIYVVEYWNYEVKSFIIGNWNKAKQIVERIT